MTKRKIISLLLTLVMVAATAAVFSGCGGDDPLAVYNKAAENMAKADDYKYDGDMVFKMTAQGQSFEMKMDMDVDYIKPAGDDVLDYQMKAVMNMEMLGQKMESTVYVKDKTSYSDTDGTKTKTPLTDENSTQLVGMVNAFKDFKIDKFVKDSKMDGDKITFTLDSKKLFAEIGKKFGDGGLDTFAQLGETLKNADFQDSTFEVVVKDENFTSEKLVMPMSMNLSDMTGAAVDSSQDQKMDAEITVELKDIKINTGEKIEFPDFKDYK